MSNKIQARGRKSKIDIDVVKKHFLRHVDICKNCNIKYNDPVFALIAKELENQMTPYALFRVLKRHYHEIFPMNDQENISQSSQSRSASPSCHSTASSFENVVTQHGNEKVKTISFCMDEYDWKKIQPITMHYIRRDIKTASTHKKYKTLPKFKWATLLREKLWESSRLPCTWNFKNRMVDNANNVHIHGKCSQCNRIAIIESKSFTEKIVNMTCNIIFDETYKNVVHDPKKKSKLTPYKRRQLSKKLEYKPAVVLHKELAVKTIYSTDVASPPVLPSMEALRKIRTEKRQSHRLHAHPLFSILMMTTISTYTNFIRGLTLIPNFQLYYWSEEQMKFYDIYYSSVPKVTLTIDATGSFFRAITLPDGSTLTKRLFLYAAMITSDRVKATPIFQMISDCHSKDAITMWLRKWIDGRNNPPHEIITDDSSALIAANVAAFTKFKSVKDYIKRSFLILNGQNYDLPSVFIRLDTSHFIKTIHNLRCFENIEMNIKMFYIRCIIFIKHCESFETIKTVIGEIVKISLTIYDSGENTHCQTSVRKLKSLLGSIDCKQPEIDKNEIIGENLSLNDDENILFWFDEMIEKQKTENDYNNNMEVPSTTQHNIYYMPHIISTLKRLLLKLPLWSNVMCPMYNCQNKTPTSSGIENYFKTMKHFLFETRLKKYSIDEYLKIHFDYLLGEMKLALSNLRNIEKYEEKVAKKTRKRKITPKSNTDKKSFKKQKKNLKKTFSNDSVFSEIPSYIENWGGQGISMKQKTDPIMFLKNGNFSNFKYDNISLSNTCALDSVFFLLALGYKENINVRGIFDQNNNKEITNYLKILSYSNNVDEANRLRIKIASAHFVKENYSCHCNVVYIFENILNNIIFSATSLSRCAIDICPNSEPRERKHIFLPLDLNIINVFTIKGLEDAITLFDRENISCRKCNEPVEVTYSLSDIVSFELNGTKNMLLYDIPQIIVIKQKTFKLLGATEYISAIHGSIGHYKCHFVKNEGQFFCYDDNRSTFHDSTNTPICVHSLTYGCIDKNL